MPIKIKSDLPACRILENENIFVMTENRAISQDIRPLKIAIVNLMPTKIATETQLLRLLANTPLQIEVFLVRMENHESTHTSQEHLEKFYIGSHQLQNHHFDGLIITGAPVEQISFEQVDYWNDLCKIMDWAETNVFSTLFICWGSQAGLYHYYNINKQLLDKKLFGIFKNKRTTIAEPLLRGFDDEFFIPQSRHTTVSIDSLLNTPDLTVLSQSETHEPTIIKSNDNKKIFITGHLEYDTTTLAEEFWRDKNAGLDIAIPKNYFPDNNIKKAPFSSWRSTAHLFYSNWLNYYVYQETPFNFAE